MKESYLDYLWDLLMRPMGNVDRIDTLGVISIYYIMCDAPVTDKVGVIDQLTRYGCYNATRVRSVKRGLQFV